MTDRRARLLERIDVGNQRGLELGPLHNPLIEREGTQVLYVDHADTATLRRKYEGHDVGEIVDVDVVWDQRLASALGDRAPVGYVVASHVIEHVPDLVGWLGELAEVLATGGALSLAIPDKRFCFDRRRAESRLGEVIEAHLQARLRPSPCQVFDFWSSLHEIDTAAAWAGTVDDDTPLGQDELAMSKVTEAAASVDYVDVHCWVFTPTSFLDTVSRLMALDLVPWYRVATFHPTEPGSLEFHVTLERLPDDLPVAERRRRQEASVELVSSTAGSATVAHSFVLLSEKERRVVAAKRMLLGKARAGARRVRGRLP